LLWVTVLQEEHAAEGFSSPFEVNFGLFFWTWVVFIMVFFALKQFAWPAIVKATEERERKIAHQLEQADKANQEAQRVLEEHRELLAGAREDSHRMLAEAKTAAENERTQTLAKARAEQEQILERARREIAAERDRALTELRREAVDLSLAAAARLIQQRLDSDADRKIVEQYLGSIEGGQ